MSFDLTLSTFPTLLFFVQTTQTRGKIKLPMDLQQNCSVLIHLHILQCHSNLSLPGPLKSSFTIAALHNLAIEFITLTDKSHLKLMRWQTMFVHEYDIFLFVLRVGGVHTNKISLFLYIYKLRLLGKYSIIYVSRFYIIQ